MVEDHEWILWKLINTWIIVNVSVMYSIHQDAPGLLAQRVWANRKPRDDKQRKERGMGWEGTHWVIPPVIIRNTAVILQPHPGNQMCSRKCFGQWLRKTRAPGPLLGLRLVTCWSPGASIIFPSTLQDVPTLSPLFPGGRCSPKRWLPSRT